MESEEEVLWDLAKNCIAKLEFASCVVYLLDGERKSLSQKATYTAKGPEYSTASPVKIKMNRGVIGSVLKTGVPELIHDTSKDSRYPLDNIARLSELCVPIADEGAIYGVIDCGHPKKNFFTENHLRLLSAVASLCAIKIKSLRAQLALQDKQQKLLEIRKEMMELKFNAFNSHQNPHFVFNAINAIQSFIVLGEKKPALEYLSIFSKLVRFYLKHLESNTVVLTDEVEMLNWYLRLQALRYSHRFEHSTSILAGNGSPKTNIPYLPVITLLENMIDYSIPHKTEKQYLEVIFHVLKKEVVLEVSFYSENKKPVQYREGYLHRMKEWQKQVQNLRRFQPFQIKMDPNFINTDTVGEKIKLRLPNIY